MIFAKLFLKQGRFLPLLLVQQLRQQMMNNPDEIDHEHPEIEHPCEMLIDRSFMDSGKTTNRKKLEDSDFSINGALIAFMRAKSSSDAETTPTTDGAEDDGIPPSAQSDPYPWMRCCGRNFMHSVFSLQPSRAPKRGLGRRRRGASHGQRGQPTP